MNKDKLKSKIDLLHKQTEKLFNRFGVKNESTRIEDCKILGEAICECLPILLTGKEAKSTVRKFVQIIDRFEREPFHLIETYQRLVDALNSFVVRHEDWPKVEAYAEDETTVDFDFHGMAVVARKILFRIEKKKLKIDQIFWASLDGQTNGLCIVSDTDEYSSAFGLTQGVHFFETVLLKDQDVHIGWKTRGCLNGKGSHIEENKLIKHTVEPIDDQHSIGFEGNFQPGTVLGCLLDFTQHTFALYVNGGKVKFQQKVPFSSNPYYVQAKGALLYFNFGQVPFKYPPAQLAACPTTDLASQTNRYALYKDVYLMPLVDNQVEPYFTDEKQEKVKGTLCQLWREGGITKESVAIKYEELWNEESFRAETYGLRWMQAIIEMENVDEGKANDWAILVEALVEFTSETWDSEFKEFIVPYSKLQADKAAPVYRTLAILFAAIVHYKTHFYTFTSYYPDSSSPFFFFLFSAFLITNDPITAMFTLIGMETVNTNDPITTMFSLIKLGVIPEKALRKSLLSLFSEDDEEWANTELTDKLQQWKGIIENKGKMDNSLAQLPLVIQHFEHYFLFPTVPHFAPTPASLSPSKCSSQAKLSSDNLSLRSDFGWQSACSHLSVDNSLSLEFPIFYFEATLLTSGPMRIGWATQRWQVDGTKLGDTEFSFAYDGNTGCIWHQDVQMQVKNAPKWQAGDVIGCLLDLENKQFAFYQNGEAIQLNGDIYSRMSKESKIINQKIIHVYERNDSLKTITPFISGHPYHAALSLGPYQQVTVNFGNTFFRFPPKCLDVWDFQQYSEHLEVHGSKKRFKSINISRPTNAIINIESKTTTGNVSINQSVASTKPTTEEPPFLIKEPSVCDVCQKASNFRLRTLQDCTHFAFCVACSSKEPLTCRKCPP